MKYHSFDPKTEQRRIKREQRRRDAAQREETQRAESLRALEQSLAQQRVSPAPRTPRAPREVDKNWEAWLEIEKLVNFIGRSLEDEIKLIRSNGIYRLFKGYHNSRAVSLMSARYYGFIFEDYRTAKAILNRVMRLLADKPNSRQATLEALAIVFIAADIRVRTNARAVLRTASAKLRKEVCINLLKIRRERKKEPRNYLKHRHMNHLGYGLGKNPQT